MPLDTKKDKTIKREVINMIHNIHLNKMALENGPNRIIPNGRFFFSFLKRKDIIYLKRTKGCNLYTKLFISQAKYLLGLRDPCYNTEAGP